MDNARPSLKLADSLTETSETPPATLDARVLSSLLIKLKVESAPAAPRDAHTRLAELTRSATIQSLLAAAGNLAAQQNIPAESALAQMIADLFELDRLWNQVLLKEGVARLTSQYH